MAIIGSETWIHQRGSSEIRDELKSWLRYSLTVAPDMQLTIRRDATSFDVCDTVLSRCEISLAYQRLPKRLRWLLWDSVCKRRPDYEVAISKGIHADSVRRQVDRGLSMIEAMVYEHLEKHDPEPIAEAT